MSEILLGVLRMPPELFWNENPLTRMQHDSIRYEAADEIERLKDALGNIIERSNNGDIGTSKVRDMREIAEQAIK